MRLLLILCLFSFSAVASETLSIRGQVHLPAGCGKKAMVWLSLDKESYKERLLLMHTEVPQNGTFEFYVKPGNYQVRASDPEGCEFLKKLTVKTKPASFEVRLVKK